MTPTPNYYAVIPSSILYHKELSADDKLFYARLTTLVGQSKACEIQRADLPFDAEARLACLTAFGYLSFRTYSSAFQIILA